MSSEAKQDTEAGNGDGTPSRAAYLPYPSSRLGAKIVPQDLTTFKSRGVTRVERELHQQLVELREQYLAVIDSFNWNKLVYESQFSFEPTIGESYHLYEIRGRHHLSMIAPEEWNQRWIGSFRLNSDSRWEPVRISPEFDLREWTNTSHPRE